MTRGQRWMTRQTETGGRRPVVEEAGGMGRRDRCGLGDKCAPAELR